MLKTKSNQLGENRGNIYLLWEVFDPLVRSFKTKPLFLVSFANFKNKMAIRFAYVFVCGLSVDCALYRERRKLPYRATLSR